MIAFRPMAAADRHLVISAWTQSYRTAHTAGMIQDADWYRVMDEQVDKALGRPDVRTVVAYDPDETDHIADVHGFITADTLEKPPLVYYCYVKQAYRRAGNGRLWSGPGLARQLFAAVGIDPNMPFHYVCSTPMVRKLDRKIPLAKWTPLYGRFPKSERRDRR